MQFKHVFVVGAGGIGSHLMESLGRLLAYHPNGTRNIVLIDGDSYEEKNRIRQLFDAQYVGKNKAEVLAKKIEDALFPIRYIPEYIDKEKFEQIVSSTLANRRDPFMVVTAVDNHATRKAIIEALDAGEYPNFVFISSGNGYANGQIMTYVKILGEKGTVHPFDKYDDLKYPDDHIPGTPGCQAEAPSTPQLITANASAALGVLWIVQAMLGIPNQEGKIEDGDWFEELHFDSLRMKIAPQGDRLKFPSVEIK